MWGIQATGGSSSIPSEFDRYRQVARWRARCWCSAAKQLGVAPSDCRTENGAVIAGDRRLRYGELAAAAARSGTRVGDACAIRRTGS